jgi:hypothetical protein
MLLGEPHHVTVWELFDPVGRLPHPILDGDGEAWAVAIAVEHVSLRAFFGGESGAIVDKACPKEFKLFSLGVVLPGPLFTVLPVFVFSLFEGLDETTGDVSDGVEVVCNLNGGGGSAW